MISVWYFMKIKVIWYKYCERGIMCWQAQVDLNESSNVYSKEQDLEVLYPRNALKGRLGWHD